MSLWNAALASVLKHEGGYVHDPNDAGGETNHGISKRAYPHLDIKRLTVEEAAAIYERDYWRHVPENLPDDARWLAFDTAVHSGVNRMRALVNEDDTLLGLAAARLKFLANLSAWEHFGRGWTRRVAGVLSDIREWQLAENPAEETRVASTVVLHGFPLALRWAVLSSSPAVLRGEFVWRSRGAKLDVRAMR